LRHDDPELAVELRMEEDPVDFGEGGPDIRIGYGELPYTGVECEPLVRDFLIPVCALDFDPEAKADSFIHTDWGASYASLPVWRDWARHADRSAPDPRRGLKAGAAALALDMAIAGLGIALGNALYGMYDITAGRLRIPFGPAVPMGAPYTICYRGRRPHVADLVARIRAVAEQDMSAAEVLVKKATALPNI
jgi:LysR family glycine cleavage system transcriptional activator